MPSDSPWCRKLIIECDAAALSPQEHKRVLRKLRPSQALLWILDQQPLQETFEVRSHTTGPLYWILHDLTNQRHDIVCVERGFAPEELVQNHTK